MTPLLPRDALRGKRIAISVSESPDLQRLGLLEIHFRLALAEIARSVLVLGGGLAYGGHLEPTGYTTFLMQELQKYGRRDSPLLVCLAWQEHRRYSLQELSARREELGLFGRIVCLDPDGDEVDPAAGRGDDAVPVDDDALRRRALTAMRRYMGTRTAGRILLGGRRTGFQGEIPGLMEEALVSLDLGQPLYLAGGFGGVTADIARSLKLDDGAWLPDYQDAPPVDPRWAAGEARLAHWTADDTWTGPNNGLSEAENRRLAATHRPGEIASLVSLGLGRRHQARSAPGAT